jgi:uncharacterized damage-inducible protein DinB
LLACALSRPAFAADAGTPPAPPGFRSDLVGVVGHIEKQLVSLEQAIPQGKFTWRPGKGVRSVAEVYLHVSGSIYFLLGKLGHEPPSDVAALLKSDKWEAQTTKRDEIKTLLTNAFAFLRKTVEEMSDADLEKMIDFFGHQASQRTVLFAVVSHCSEHLGQSIAYARMNAIVPPWSKPGAGD